MDNASYHCKVVNKAPIQSSRKQEILKWLVENDLPHNPLHTKAELLHIVKKNKEKEEYAVDEMADKHGHEVLRLPPYHCQLNPIELIWAQVKEEIRKNNSNSSQKLRVIEELTRKAMNNVTVENWKKCVAHTKKVEDEFRRNDIVVNHMVEKFIINISNDSSSDEE
ncbi:hypothetical protein Pmani_017589 [Petrolisthes manimaculis]|uniref:Tc1-like transposase DDE domain-containing protein n=1 Tax=Petrolisthes manimaculis TaxID=1843537 RepID=A0AAE1U5B7_9EUCA|nr:hypothetical protein Pmani_017589 [Petrolisthes manimaculis]